MSRHALNFNDPAKVHRPKVIDHKIFQENEEVRGQIVEEGVFYHAYKEFPQNEAEGLWSTE